jgi:hypothetical protein
MFWKGGQILGEMFLIDQRYGDGKWSNWELSL